MVPSRADTNGEIARLVAAPQNQRLCLDDTEERSAIGNLDRNGPISIFARLIRGAAL
ncbi:hypothetical protein N181_29365 [Sinorhizobium fredii USDA 205]|nr:hypothetical protein SF83666_b64320 [Sinorhizobium fredii CCBAU 83666]KSV80414.1 hypothetical protein N181_29365 [Sinorhizobium fredii USDA 205]